MTAEKMLIVALGIIGCLVIYILQHRKKEIEVTEELTESMKDYQEEMVVKFYDEYIRKLLTLRSSNILEASQAFAKVIEIIDQNLPFFKTGYMTTLIICDDRYLKLVNNLPEDMTDVFNKLESMIGQKDKDMEELADLTLMVLRWYGKRVGK